MIKNDVKNVIALIVAGGEGTRAGGEIPKQYTRLGGMPVLRRTVMAFLQHPRIASVQVVIHPAHRALYDAAVEDLNLPEPVTGGGTRQESVHRGLQKIQGDWVLIHDAARPLVSPALISRVIDELTHAQAVIPVLPVADTLKKMQHQKVMETLDRDGVVVAQTPQGFYRETILAAHEKGTITATDDAALAEQFGVSVATVAGERSNIKITTQEDFTMAELFLGTTYETRVGQGFDVHKLQSHGADVLTPDRVIHLGGVAIPHTYGLVGHSDADVGLHAAVDAVLGAMGAGDIGLHFPPHDARWRGARSSIFLRHAMELLRERGGRLVHLDLTFICEAPRLTPYREPMRVKIAEICGVGVDRISVKATTTEKLGFCGRGEGIAAQAVATVQVPVRGME